MLVFSIALIIGYSNAQQWAWKGSFYYYGLYLFGKIGGLIISAIYINRILEVTSILEYGEVQPLPISPEFVISLGAITILVQSIIIFFILRSVYKNKDYFKN